MKKLAAERGITFAHHQVEVFLMDPGTDRYLGRLCNFRRCPADKTECCVPGCGRERFLRQVEGFDWRDDALGEVGVVVLYDRYANPPIPAEARHFDDTVTAR